MGGGRENIYSLKNQFILRKEINIFFSYSRDNHRCARVSHRVEKLGIFMKLGRETMSISLVITNLSYGKHLYEKLIIFNLTPRVSRIDEFDGV